MRFPPCLRGPLAGLLLLPASVLLSALTGAPDAKPDAPRATAAHQAGGGLAVCIDVPGSARPRPLVAELLDGRGRVARRKELALPAGS